MWLLFHPPFDHELWTRMNLPINPSCKRSTGGEWLPLPVQGVVSYVVCWNICDRDQDFWSAKSVLDRLIISSKALDRFIFFTGQRSNWNCAFLILWFLQFRGYLDPLVSSQKGFDRLIQFWSRSQMLLHRTYRWLSLALPQGNQIMKVGVHHQQPFHFHLLEQNLHPLCPASIVCSCMSWRE